MAKATPSADSKGKGRGKPAPLEGVEKALPTRPGTSGTEHLLITNRRQASEQFVKAQRAEKAYRAKKHASLAKYNYADTKGHFKESFTHCGLGMKGLVSVIRAVPYLIRDKREKRRQKAELAKRQRDLERKKKLEEELARQEVDDDADEEHPE
ncbi:uncharacterized protein BCR38DRAFT_345436 [Pseudomassariella vexata]|uniref:Uncharacterized protein n=1 Tax=Pseudomassariella vexata TaxID=1141098 RepID=A0A1Y2DUZ9_9PEZI|nr:uncharacterized protein BCR38DRAFT_345436 [Pseudomassariella vexata]ORY62954.1 hypothetical protein BCR38DRAFT_345436 [Pseudomassariella vexata]